MKTWSRKLQTCGHFPNPIQFVSEIPKKASKVKCRVHFSFHRKGKLWRRKFRIIYSVWSPAHLLNFESAKNLGVTEHVLCLCMCCLGIATADGAHEGSSWKCLAIPCGFQQLASAACAMYQELNHCNTNIEVSAARTLARNGHRCWGKKMHMCLAREFGSPCGGTKQPPCDQFCMRHRCVGRWKKVHRLVRCSLDNPFSYGKHLPVKHGHVWWSPFLYIVLSSESNHWIATSTFSLVAV